MPFQKGFAKNRPYGSISNLMLQVLTGSQKGRKLKVPKGSKVRPPTSRVKKSIFDRLGDISGLRVLDVFSGSGSLGIESLSRDTGHVTFIEKDPAAFKVLTENLTLCGFLGSAELLCSDYENALRKLKRHNESYDLIFVDPPYELYKTMKVSDFVENAGELLRELGILIIEHDHKIEDSPAGFSRFTKPFGGTHVSYFTKEVSSE